MQSQCDRVDHVFGRGDVGHVQLVDFEDQVGGVLAGHECGDDAGIHVVTAVVGGYGVLGADCSG